MHEDVLCGHRVTNVPVDGGPGIVNYALLDWDGPEMVQMYCNKTDGLVSIRVNA